VPISSPASGPSSEQLRAPASTPTQPSSIRYAGARIPHRVEQVLSIGSKNFYAFYLLSHGLIKMFLVIGLLRNKLWSYPASLVVMGLFIIYQLYRFSYTGSFGLIAITALDVVVMVLIWHEYRLMLRHTMVGRT